MIANINIAKHCSNKYTWELHFFQTDKSVLSDCSVRSDLTFQTEEDCVEHMKKIVKMMFPDMKMQLTD